MEEVEKLKMEGKGDYFELMSARSTKHHPDLKRL
jgi:hypothetical protein